MDYQKHYDLLCERARTRSLEGYTERHHIIPRCMGGTDQPDNLVDLTPEEHYVVHQLLVKMYPEHRGLAHSAYMMTVGSEKAPRKNKLYGWLRKKHSKAAKQRTGEKNSSYGRSWYHDPITLRNGKFLDEDVPTGWLKGRTPQSSNTLCEVCSCDTGTPNRRFCNDHRPKSKSPSERGYVPTEKAKAKLSEYCKSRKRTEHPQYGKRWVNDETRSIMADKDDLQQYLDLGWKRGKIKGQLAEMD